MTDKPTPEQIQREVGMTRDEATGIWMASFNAWCEHPLPANERVAREAAATVIQQAFAERDGGIERLREALVQHNERLRSAQAIAQRDGADTNWLAFRGQCTFTLAEYHDLVNEARQALAAKGDSRG